MVKKWITLPSNYVDIETGEALTEYEAKQNYSIIKTEKHVTITKEIDKKTYNKINIGYIHYTHECRSTRQLKLFS